MQAASALQSRSLLLSVTAATPVGTMGRLSATECTYLPTYPAPSGEAGSDPRGHLWVTWGVYLCAGKPPLADIILSHPSHYAHFCVLCAQLVG